MFAMGPAFFKQAVASYATLALTGTFAAATVGAAYSSSIPISGGLEPYSLTGGTGVASGALDSGFSLSITGTPGARFLTLSCASPPTAHAMAFTGSVDSSDAQTATSAQSVVVAPETAFSQLSYVDIGAGLTLSNGALTVVTSNGTSGPWSTVRANMGKSTGKWYFEVTNVAHGATNGDAMWGFMLATDSLATYPGNASLTAASMGWEANLSPDSARFQDGALGAVSGYGGLVNGGISYFAIDLDAGKLWVRNSNKPGWALGGDPALGTSPTFTFTPGSVLYPALGLFSGSQTTTANFGASAFDAAVPAGFNAGWFGPRPPGAYTTYQSRFTTSGTNDAQGVATDGNHLWFSNSTTIFKYTLSGTLVTSRNVSGDSPTDKVQINGMFHKDGVLHVSAAKYAAGVATSWVVRYDPSTLAYLGQTTISSNKFSEGLAFSGGYWWVVFHADMICAQYDAGWALVAEHALTFKVTGSSGGYGPGTGYDGIAWVGSYMLANIHEIYDQDFLDVYKWTGSGFTKVNRLPRVSSPATQGMCVDPATADAMWFAERAPSGTDSVALAKYFVV